VDAPDGRAVAVQDLAATRAEADGADTETIVCALLHDIGDIIGTANHSQVAAALLRPYVSDQNYWVVNHHGLFQGYYYFEHYGRDRNERDRYSDHPYYQACVDFCAKYDQNCFDPDYPTKPLEYWEPMVREIFARPPHDMF
jgi:predicted HD phosphohydrolase